MHHESTTIYPPFYPPFYPPVYPPFFPPSYPPFFKLASLLCLNHLHVWTTHFTHPVILYPSLSLPQHRSLSPTINRSIQRSHIHSTHRSLLLAISPGCLIVVYAWIAHFSHPILPCPAFSLPHHHPLLPSYIVFFECTTPLVFYSQISLPIHSYVVPFHITRRRSTTLTTEPLVVLCSPLCNTPIATRSCHLYFLLPSVLTAHAPLYIIKATSLYVYPTHPL